MRTKRYLRIVQATISPCEQYIALGSRSNPLGRRDYKSRQHDGPEQTVGHRKCPRWRVVEQKIVDPTSDKGLAACGFSSGSSQIVFQSR